MLYSESYAASHWMRISLASSPSSITPSPENRLRQIALAVGLEVKNAGPASDHAALAVQTASGLGASIVEAAAIALSIARTVSEAGLDAAVGTAAIDAATRAALEAASTAQTSPAEPAPPPTAPVPAAEGPNLVTPPPSPPPVSAVDLGKLGRILASLTEWTPLETLAAQTGTSVEDVKRSLKPMEEQGYVAIAPDGDFAYVTGIGHRFFEYSMLSAR